jgi:anti-anti-sigma regulatory factor
MNWSVSSTPRRFVRMAGLRRLVSIAQHSRHRLTDPGRRPTTSPTATHSPLTDKAPLPIVPRISRVDDPFVEMSLIAIRGEVDHATISELHDVLLDVDAGRFLHLDLGDALITTGWAMRQLEQTADDLEQRGVVLRVVGLDPQHPLLANSL